MAFTKRTLNHWLRAAWPVVEHSLAVETMGLSGRGRPREKRAPRFDGRDGS